MKHSLWLWSPVGGAMLIALPLLTIGLSLLNFDWAAWVHLGQTRLPELAWNSLCLTIGVGIGTFLLGTSLAWLMVMYRLPGQRFLEWALVLPLAIPAYVIGFIFLSQWDYSAPLPTLYRTWFGREAWFPNVRSYGGVVFCMTLVLYPYVYLLARNAFREQNFTLMEVARSLGVERRHLFWKVALPMARPSIAAGMALALMESLADFGTVSLFSYDTFTTAIYQLWFGMFDRSAALQVAGLLLLLTLGLFYLEEYTRGQAKYYQIHGKARFSRPFELQGWKLWLFTAYPWVVVGMAFVIPFVTLVIWMFQAPTIFDSSYWNFATNTLMVAGVAAILAVGLAVLFAYSKRLFPGVLTRFSTRLACLGYALPGTVIALGVLIPLSQMDHWLNDLSERYGAMTLGLILTGSLVSLVFAYTVRFMAVAFNPIETNLSKITLSMDMAAQSLGHSRREVLWRIHFPLIQRGLAGAFLLVFVDVMKEMPATLLLRPFGFETLATRVWQMTSESLWEEAALPALTIVLIGLLPVILLISLSSKRSAPTV